MAKLLQGYTNVLTPVNLLPNADFHMGGGVSSDNTVNTDRHIDFNKKIDIANCTFTDFSFSRSRGECRIKGYVTPLYDDRECYLKIVFDEGSSLIRDDNTLYTVAMRAKSNQPSNNKGKIYFTSSFAGNGSYLATYYHQVGYYMTNEYTQSVSIHSMNPGGTCQVTFWIALEHEGKARVPYYIDVTVKDLRLFEGAYVNPPAGRSIDRAETKFPMFVGMDLKYNSNLENFGLPIQKVHLFKTEQSDAKLTKRFEMVLSSADLTYAGLTQIFVANLWLIPGNQYVGNLFKRYLIKCYARNYSNSIQIASESITEMTDYSMSWHASDHTTRNITFSISHLSEVYQNKRYNHFILYGSTSDKMPNAVPMIIQPLIIYGDNGNFLSGYPHYQNNARVIWKN